MRKIITSTFFIIFFYLYIYGQSVSFQTYVNPVIPGDHPDPTLTKIGDNFYTTGSSFNITPRIYHSTDLVHWQVISQPVSAAIGRNRRGGDNRIGQFAALFLTKLNSHLPDWRG